MVRREVIGLIVFIAFKFLAVTFSMNHCMRRNIRIFTKRQNSRYMSIETSCSDVETFPNVDIGGKTGGFDLGGSNSSWEFGSFNCKSRPTIKERENFEKQKLEETNIVKTDISWVDSLSDEELDRGITELSKYCSKERSERFDLILKERTSNVRMIYENPANANNVWASLRTLDAFGIQYIDVITQQSAFDSSWRRKIMQGAMGTQKWLSLQEQPDTITCIKALKRDGYRVLVSDIHESSKSVHDIDWGAQPTAIIMGNEENGCSQTAKDLADDRFYIPMKVDLL
jgi:tRNA G18 (ribose-2'-O)-methylase SpoU